MSVSRVWLVSIIAKQLTGKTVQADF